MSSSGNGSVRPSGNGGLELIENPWSVGADYATPARISEASECELPRLRGALLSGNAIGLAAREDEPGALVDPPRRAEIALGPERDPPVARVAREMHARVDETAADAVPARGRLDVQQSELRDRRGLAHQE